MQEFRIFRALGLGFKSWFRNFIPFTLLSAVLYAPVIIWVLTFDPTKATSLEDEMNMMFVRPVYALIGLSALLAPLISYRVVQDLNGQKVSIFTSIKYGLRGILPAIFLAVIVNVIQMVPMGGIVSAILTCMWFVATPAAVAEKLNPFTAFSRSAELTRGRRWGIFGLTFLMGIALVIMIVIWFVPLLQKADNGGDVLAQFKQSVLFMMITVGVFQMLNGIVQAVSYALLRQDKDGVSHSELAAIFE